MAKIVSQTITHYGKDYIAYALRAVEPHVDKVLVFLTDKPSHGTDSGLVCPDSIEDMREAINGAGIGSKLEVIEGRWGGESDHRNAVFSHVDTGDLIVVADADEIWSGPNLNEGIISMNVNPNIRNYKVRMTTLWRSFGFQCTDPMTQDRIIRVGMNDGVIYSPVSSLPDNPDIWHFGYARKPKDVAYKISIHGHVGSIFPYWYQDKFLDWTPDNGVTDCHPDCERFWYPKPFDKNLLPDDMKNHPYFNLDIIRDDS